MYRNVIKNYIDRLKKEDVVKYIDNNDYVVSDKEIDTIYFYIKNYWENFIDDKDDIWKKLKNDVSSNTYIEIVRLYQKYKKYI